MEDILKLVEWFTKAYGPVALIVAGIGYLIWMQRPSKSKETADASGQIEALSVYKELLATERASRAQEVSRADQLAIERNEAIQKVWELTGRLDVMAEQIKLQTLEIQSLRAQVQEFREKLNVNQ